MMFKDGFFENLPEDRIEAASEICEQFQATCNLAGQDSGARDGHVWPPLSYGDYVEAWAIRVRLS